MKDRSSHGNQELLLHQNGQTVPRYNDARTTAILFLAAAYTLLPRFLQYELDVYFSFDGLLYRNGRCAPKDSIGVPHHVDVTRVIVKIISTRITSTPRPYSWPRITFLY